MPDSYFVLVRRQKKLELLDFLKSTSETNLEKCLALFSWKTGLRLEIVRKYYEEIKEAGLIA